MVFAHIPPVQDDISHSIVTIAKKSHLRPPVRLDDERGNSNESKNELQPTFSGIDQKTLRIEPTKQSRVPGAVAERPGSYPGITIERLRFLSGYAHEGGKDPRRT